MTDVIASTAKDLAAAVDAPASVHIDRSSSLSELSLVGALAALIVFVLLMFGGLLLHRWPDSQAPAVIHYLGWGLLLAVGGVLLVVAALASPFIGRVQASAGPAKIDLEGRA